jgi:hypothetical protein
MHNIWSRYAIMLLKAGLYAITYEEMIPLPAETRVYQARVLVLTLVSLSACVALVLRFDSRVTGELADRFSDHLHHGLASWTFLRKGLGVYHGAFGATADTSFPYFGETPWPDMPVTYPVGMFVYFLPPVLLAQKIATSSAEVGRILTLYIVVTSHLAFLGVARALRRVSGFRTFLLLAVALLFARMCLLGFYDSVWVGCGAMSISALSDRRPRASLMWFAVAALLSLKAVSFAPVALGAAWLLLRERKPHGLLALVPPAIACAHALWVVVITFKHLPAPGTAIYEAAKSPLLPLALRGHVVIATGLGVALLLLTCNQRLTALSVLLATYVTLHHAGHSWHGALLIASVLLPGAWDSSRGAPLARQVLTLWMIFLWQFAYAQPLFAVVEDVMTAVPRLR